MLGSKFVSQLNKWLKAGTRNRRVQLEVGSPLFTDRGDKRAYFTLTIDEQKFPFYIGRDGEEFSAEFGADYSGNCMNKAQCVWNAAMEEFLFNTDDLSVATVLNEAVNIALSLDTEVKTSTIKVPKKQNRSTDIQDLFAMVKSYMPNVVVTPSSMNEWLVTIRNTGEISNLVLNLSVKMSPLGGYYGIATVVMPRLDITRDVDFGGVVTCEGLTSEKPVSTRKEILSRLSNVMKSQKPYILDIPYNKEEAKVCLSKRERLGGVSENVTIVLHKKLRNDEVGVPFDWYNTKLRNEPQLFAEVTGEMGLSGCYAVVPMEYRTGLIGLSALSLVNLNIKTKTLGMLALVTLKHPTSITVRPRASETTFNFNINEERFKNKLAEHKVLTVGHTYAIGGEYDFYIDVLDIYPAKACTLTDTEFSGREVALEINYDLFIQPDPLAVSSYESDTEESSD